MATISTASSSTKRKRGSEMKFYAVRAGHTPGIYHSWADCKEQVTGFKGAQYKSFPSLTDAQAFCNGDDMNPGAHGPPKKYYAVRSGRVPGIYTDWESASQQIKGWNKPRHKSFLTRAEAEAFMQETETEATASTIFPLSPSGETPAPVKYETSVLDNVTPQPKKAKTSKAKQIMEMPTGPGFDFLPPNVEDGFDRNIILDPASGNIRYKTEYEMNAMKLLPNTQHHGQPLRIWTDGACMGNGKGNAVAGVGVYFGPQDPRNVGEPLLGRQTNQRAELMAMKRALNLSPMNRPVTIYSDSKYSINCVTTWFPTWRKNGWKTGQKKDVENKDLIQEILEIVENRHICGVPTIFNHVKGHSGVAENEAADRLAVLGANECRAKGINLMTQFKIPAHNPTPMGRVAAQNGQWVTIRAQEDDLDEFVDAQEQIDFR